MNPLRLEVSESSQVSEARRLAARLARDLGFPDTEQGNVALVVTELATNLVKHTPHGGELLVRPVSGAGVPSVEILSLDRGPGLTSVANALRDGYSTAGSAGTGLGAVRRKARSFDLYSRPGKGLAVLAQVAAGGRAEDRPAPDRLEGGGVRVAKGDEPVSGDDWAVVLTARRSLAIVVDGLGHGILAGEAASQAVRAFHENSRLPAAELMGAVHEAMKPTRGGVAGIAEIDAARGTVEYVGVGNISAIVLGEGVSRNMVSQNGTLGQEARRIRSYSYPWRHDSVLVMHSDGISHRWDLSDYPGLALRSPSLIAGVLYRDFARGSDDVGILVLKSPGERTLA